MRDRRTLVIQVSTPIVAWQSVFRGLRVDLVRQPNITLSLF